MSKMAIPVCRCDCGGPLPRIDPTDKLGTQSAMAEPIYHNFPFLAPLLKPKKCAPRVCDMTNAVFQRGSTNQNRFQQGVANQLRDIGGSSQYGERFGMNPPMEGRIFGTQNEFVRDDCMDEDMYSCHDCWNGYKATHCGTCVGEMSKKVYLYDKGSTEDMAKEYRARMCKCEKEVPSIASLAAQNTAQNVAKTAAETVTKATTQTAGQTTGKPGSADYRLDMSRAQPKTNLTKVSSNGDCGFFTVIVLCFILAAFYYGFVGYIFGSAKPK